MNTNPYAMHERFKDRIHNPHNLPWEEFGDPTIWRPALKDEIMDVRHEFYIKGAGWFSTVIGGDWPAENYGSTYRIRLSDRPWPKVEESELEALRQEVESLRAWKESAMQGEAEWDPQALAKKLGGVAALGRSCRKAITEGVERLLASPWGPLTKRTPTKEDANEDGDVLWWLKKSGACTAQWDDGYCARESTHWMPIPPLPEAPEVEAAEEWVLLEAEDVPPGSAIRAIGITDTWMMVAATHEEGVWGSGEDLITWSDLAAGYEILRPGSSEWQPCKKLKSI